MKVGCDIVELSRIKESVEKFGDRFINRILTAKEKEIYISRNSQISFLAGRFSVKEAVSKAIGTGIAHGLSFTDIEILPDEKGKPVLYLYGEKKDGADVSISHSRDNAIAVCVME